MSAYLLNLVFTKPPSANTATGLFTEDSTAPNALRSKVWYTVPAGWPVNPLTQPGPVLAIPPVATWGTPAPDGSLSCALGDDVYIRVVPDSSWGQIGQPVSGLGVIFNVTFGRLSTSNHGDATMASPFALSLLEGAGINTPWTFFLAGIPASSSPPAGDGSWIYYCGKLAQNVPGQLASGAPPVSTRFCTYSFVVGAQAAVVGGIYTYGHDPKCIVKG